MPSDWGMHWDRCRRYGVGFLRTFALLAGLVGLAACGPLGGVEGDGVDAGAGGQAGLGNNAGSGASAGVSGPVLLPPPPAFKVVGYQPAWAGSFAGLQFEKLDYINYAFAIEQADGSVTLPQATKALIDLVGGAHNAGVRVLLSVGGWNDGNDKAFDALSASPEARAKFATVLDGYVDQFQLDGVDIDWEFPELDVAANFTAMVREVSAKLKPKGKLITIAGAAFRDGAGGVTMDAMQYIDFVNIMAYDGDNGPGHSPYAFAQTGLQLWLDKGVPPAKAILGVPFYSQPGYTPYGTLVTQDPNAANMDSLNSQFYNGIPTVQAKTALAMTSAGGIMAWDLSQDSRKVDVSLLSAIYSKSHPGQ